MKNLINEIEKSFELNAEKYAIYSDGLFLKYADLKVEVFQIINWLSDLNLKVNDRIGISVEDPLLFCKFVLAVTHHGGCYVPIDTNVNSDRKREMVREANLRVIICDNSNLHKELQLETNIVVSIPNIWPNANVNQQLGIRMNEEALNIMFTSGSTGKPKGVICPVGGILPLVTGGCHLPINNEDRVLQISARTFDAFTWEFWGCIINGACLFLPPKDWSIRSLSEFIKSKNITTVFLTSRLFDSLIDYFSHNLTQLKFIAFGGEHASIHHVRLAQKLLPNVQLINVYGPSENTTFTTRYLIKENLDKFDRVPIGVTAGEDETILIDPNNLEILQGSATGELWVRGPGLAIGYTDESLTQKRFIYHPRDGHRYFRTGDLIERDSDGIYTMLGRLDREVKVRGKRIDLDEVEKNLLDIQNVSFASVSHNILGQGELIAFYSTSSGEKLSTKILIQHLQSKSVIEAIPRHFEYLNYIPMNAHGKADRTEMARNFKSEREVSIEEKDIFTIWKRYLPIDEILPETHFFEEGGDSLSAMNLMTEIETVTNLKLETNFLSRYSLFKDFCKALSEEKLAGIQNNNTHSDDCLYVFLPPIIDDRLMPFLHLSGAMANFNYIEIEYKTIFKNKSPKNINEFSKVCYTTISQFKNYKIFLIGHSSAGVFALDIASQFEDAGSKVEAVLMLDSFPASIRLLVRIKKALKNYLTLRGFKLLKNRMHRKKQNSNQHLAISENSEAIYSIGKHIGSWLEIVRFRHRIPKKARIILVKAIGNEQQIDYRKINANGWLKKIPKLEIFEFNAGHESMLNHQNSISLKNLIIRITNF